MSTFPGERGASKGKAEPLKALAPLQEGQALHLKLEDNDSGGGDGGDSNDYHYLYQQLPFVPVLLFGRPLPGPCEHYCSCPSHPGVGSAMICLSRVRTGVCFSSGHTATRGQS